MMDAETQRNWRQTVARNLPSIADGSWVKTHGAFEVINSWEDWTDSGCDWMTAPVFSDREHDAVVELTSAIDALCDVLNTDSFDPLELRKLPEYLAVELAASMAAAAFAETRA